MTSDNRQPACNSKRINFHLNAHAPFPMSNTFMEIETKFMPDQDDEMIEKKERAYYTADQSIGIRR